MAPWNPFTLTFSNRELEKRYTQESVAARVMLDWVGYCGLIVLAFIPLEGDGVVAEILKGIPSHLVAPYLIYFWSTRRAEYLPQRDFWFHVIPLLGLIYIIGKDWLLPPPSPNLRGILSRFSKSPILPSIFNMGSFPLKFRQQMLVSMCYFFGLIFWSNTFCNSLSCGVAEEFSPFIQNFGSFKDNMVAVVSMNGIGVLGPKRECFSVVFFFQVMIAIVVPLFFLYNSEVSCREDFLSRSAAESEKASIHNFSRECRAWSVWVLFFIVVLLSFVS